MITFFNYLTIYCDWGKERHYGSFSRSLPIPVKVKVDKAEAVFEGGVLTLTLPKAEEAKPKQVKVKAKQIAEGKKAEAKI